jgi:hypothetical protein
MNSALNQDLATTIRDDRIRQAERDRRASSAQAGEEPDPYPSVTVRFSRVEDHAEIRRLEQLDGRRLPPEPTLLAEVDGHVVAARSLVTRALVADPFRPTATLVELLDLRSTHLRGELDRWRGRRFGVRRLFRCLFRIVAPIRS